VSLDTYANLQTEIAAYAQRSNSAAFVAKIPTFITLAEQDIFRKLRSYREESLENLSFTASTATVSLPARCRDIKAVKLTGDTEKEIKHVPLAALTVQYADANSGTPAFFAIRGTDMVLFPTPSVNGTLEVLCVIAPAALSASNTTNTILTNYPDLYFYGSLVHAFRFIRNQERMIEAQQAYEMALSEANKESRKLKSSGTPDGVRSISRRKVV
jgi:hypothetical protein